MLYVALCGLLYFFQEKFIFFPEKLPKGHAFSFREAFEEVTIKTEDNILLNGLLFKADASKGLIFYLHGNAGSLQSWGNISKTYTDLGYDLFILDYRGFGKSEGAISSQDQMCGDAQSAYYIMKSRYSEDNIIVLGYSIGTGIATKLAAKNNPRLLILQSPYFSLVNIFISQRNPIR